MIYTSSNTNILAAGDMSTATLTSSPIDMNRAKGYAVYAKWSGSPVGTLVIQVSVDGTNYVTLAGSSQSVSGAGDFMWEISSAMYNWAQVLYTKVSGTGSLNVTANVKSEVV